MAKASWTPITGDSGAASGDPVVGYYEDSTLLTKNVIKLRLEDQTATVLRVDGETITLADLKELLNVTLGEIVFKDADGNVLNDMTVAAVNGYTIQGVSKGHKFIADGTVFASYTIALNDIEEIKVPVLSSASDAVVIDENNKTITASYYIDEPMSYQDLIKNLQVSYGEVKCLTPNEAALPDLKVELENNAVIRLLSKDCQGLPDGTVTATYTLKIEKKVKEVKFVSKDAAKVKIDAYEKVITVIKGMTVKDFLENTEIEFADTEIYDVTPEDFGDPKLITDENTVIVDGMSLLLITDAASIPYDFVTANAIEDGNKTDKNPIMGVAVPIVAFALFGAALIGVTSVKKRRR